jgi:hypothetical protein
VTQSRRNKPKLPQDAGQTRPLSQTDTTPEQGIAKARWFYAELLKFEERLEAAAAQTRNRGRFLDARGYLRKARESLQVFIGERMTSDIEQRIEAERQPSPFPEPERRGDPDGQKGGE